MILEGIAVTKNEDGRANAAPMGPIVDSTMTRLTFRPFQSSTTFRNLRRLGQGVFHVVDDVELLARAAVGRLLETPPTRPAEAVDGLILLDACRWYEFRVESLDDSQERAVIEAVVVHHGRIRDYFGLNRAKHAVLEAAVLATRLHLIPADEVDAEMRRLASPVEKTAGPGERRAFQFLLDFIAEHRNS